MNLIFNSPALINEGKRYYFKRTDSLQTIQRIITFVEEEYLTIVTKPDYCYYLKLDIEFYGECLNFDREYTFEEIHKGESRMIKIIRNACFSNTIKLEKNQDFNFIKNMIIDVENFKFLGQILERKIVSVEANITYSLN